MNILPEILRESNTTSVHRRQGPQYLLKLGDVRRTPNASSERSSLHTTMRLRATRYSIERAGPETRMTELDSRRTVNYSTISYDFRNDPEFFGVRGKRDQVESYQTLIYERQNEAAIVEAKCAAFKGTREQYEGQLKVIENAYAADLKSFQSSFMGEVGKLRQLLSDLRRETQSEIRAFKQDLKQENEQLIVYCEELKRMDANLKRVKDGLEAI